MAGDIVTPNLKELSLATGMKTESDHEITTASRKLIQENGIKTILATRSADGMSLIDGENFKTFKASSQEVYDVSGAGDTVAAALAASLASKISLEKSIMIANASAGIVVAKAGTAVAYLDEVMEALEVKSGENTEKKLLDLTSTSKQVKVWKSQQKVIGFTNGCFDLLHPGHLSTIEAAKSQCDKLIIGLNSDTSIKLLKGSNRPIQPENTRAKILASLEYVDIVIIFHDKSPVELIKLLKPDVFIKGADYKIKEMPEAQVVADYGGEIKLAKFKKGYSTSTIISKMKTSIM